MDFDLSPEYTALRKMIRSVCEEEIAPVAHKIDESGIVERDLLRRLGDLGILGVPFPREYGGMGAGEIGYCIMMEEMNRASASVATIVGAHIGIGVMSMYLDGSKALKAKYMPDLCSGKKFAPSPSLNPMPVPTRQAFNSAPHLKAIRTCSTDKKCGSPTAPSPM